MSPWKTIPWKVKEGVVIHDTREDAIARAQKVANKTGDWVIVEETGGSRVYVQPKSGKTR